MKRLSIFFLSCFLVAITSVRSAEPAASFSSGNEAFQKADFPAAISAYKETVQNQGASASLLYNLGNANFRAGNFGEAILAYEKALTLHPNAADVRANLKIAREAVTAFETSKVPRWLGPVFWLSLNQWAIALLLSLSVIGIICFVFPFSKKGKGRRILSFTTVLVLVISMVSGAILVWRKAEINRAIVIAKEAPVRLSPFASADTVATLSSGRAVQIDGENGDFYHVSKGWILKSELGRIYQR